MGTHIEIIIASLPDRTRLVAEVWIDNQQFAEISQETADVLVELYPPTKDKMWKVDYQTLVNTLEDAKNKLLSSVAT